MVHALTHLSTGVFFTQQPCAESSLRFLSPRTSSISTPKLNFYTAVQQKQTLICLFFWHWCWWCGWVTVVSNGKIDFSSAFITPPTPRSILWVQFSVSFATSFLLPVILLLHHTLVGGSYWHKQGKALLRQTRDRLLLQLPVSHF